jgi:deoxyribodipyrimidine photo-lyase
LEDNTALIYALQNSKKVSLAFFFDKRLLNLGNKYSLQFMFETLEELEHRIIKLNGTLNYFYSLPEEDILDISTKNQIDAVVFNRDYTPFSIKRDNKINETLKKVEVFHEKFADILLNEPEIILTAKNTPYKVFTPYYNTAKQILVNSPKKIDSSKIKIPSDSLDHPSIVSLDEIRGSKLPKLSQSQNVNGGRSNGEKILKSIGKYSDYMTNRDYPSLNYTTNLSAFNKFGVLSIREIFYMLDKSQSDNTSLIRQLYWRDFFVYLAFYFPHVFSGAYNKKYNNLKWENNPSFFKAWCDGMTGFPIVDAGMRQLNLTGYMHNRVRMIVASFLTKDLHIDWKKGERYFAKKLIDYDPSVNNGSWQWAASTGADAQPYFRIFNPWRQQQRFDKNCEYIKEWIPEIRDLTAKEIHSLETQTFEEKNYPKPIVDHKIRSKKAIEMYSII